MFGTALFVSALFSYISALWSYCLVLEIKQWEAEEAKPKQIGDDRILVFVSVHRWDGKQESSYLKRQVKSME